MAISGLVFGKGTLFIDVDGDNVEIGELQEASVEFRDTVKTAEGKGLYPIRTELASRQATVRCQWLQLNMEGMQKILGGSMSYSNGKGTLSVTETDEAGRFSLLLKNPSDGSEFSIKFYAVRPSNFTLPLQLKEFSKLGAEFNIEVGADGKVFDLIGPDDRPVSP